MITPAALSLVRHEVRTRWVSLVLFGVLAGVVGGLAVGALVVARRTTTAYDRLGEAVGIDDVRGTVVEPALLDQVADLPIVEDAWTGRLGVAAIEGDTSFLGFAAGPREPTEVNHPILLEGRFPEVAEPGVIEVAVREDLQKEFQLEMGTEAAVRGLTLGDYSNFGDFEGGQPHGPAYTIRIVGAYRTAGGTSGVPPAMAAPEAVDQVPDAFIGGIYFARLRNGDADADAFRAATQALARGHELPPESREFEPIDAFPTAPARAAADNTSLLLGRALAAFALSAAVVGGLALAQTLIRYHSASSDDRRLLGVLGLTNGEQVTALLGAAAIPAAVAAALTAAGAYLGGRFAPIGGIRSYEPHPGSAPNLALGLAGVAAVVLFVVGVFVASGRWTLRRRRSDALRESRMAERLSHLGGSPSSVLGLRFALEPGRGRTAVPVRAALVGAVVGIAGVAAGLVFIASVDRLTGSPSRSGVPFDVSIADVDRTDLAPVIDDPKLGVLTAVQTARLSLGDVDLNGHAIDDIRGELTVDYVSGRPARTPDEIVLGLRAARDLGVKVGDTVTARTQDGSSRPLAVVGTAVVPVFNGETLGLNALLTDEGLARAARTTSYPGAVAVAAPHQDADAVRDALASRFEADGEAVPPEVDNLDQLGRLPAGVALVVSIVAIVGLVNALIVATRRRRRDLALLRAMGFTGRQTARVILVMAGTIGLIGLALGLPLGLAAGSTLWRFTASGAYVATDPAVPWVKLITLGCGALAIAVTAAAVPAIRAARRPPAPSLRAVG